VAHVAHTQPLLEGDEIIRPDHGQKRAASGRSGGEDSDDGGLTRR